jgi:hypothetical protein
MKVFICITYSVFIVFSFIGFILEVLGAFGLTKIAQGFYAMGYLINFAFGLKQLDGVLNHGKSW